MHRHGNSFQIARVSAWRRTHEADKLSGLRKKRRSAELTPKKEWKR